MKILSEYQKEQMVQRAMDLYENHPDSRIVDEIISTVSDAILVEIITEGNNFGDIPVQ